MKQLRIPDLPRQLIGPALFGLYLSIVPDLLLLLTILPCVVTLVWFEWRRIKRGGSMQVGMLRVGMLALILMSARLVAIRSENPTISPADVEFREYPGSSLLTLCGSVTFFLPAGVTRHQLELPDEPLRLTKFIQRIERNTGLTGHAFYCGSGSSIVSGGHLTSVVFRDEGHPSSIDPSSRMSTSGPDG